MQPSDIVGFYKIEVSGTVNGEEFLSEDYEDIVNFYEEFHRPIIRAVNAEEGELREQKGTPTYGSNGNVAETERLKRLKETWTQNKEATVKMYLDINEGDQVNKYEFELIPRNDKGPEDATKAFSFMEARYNPARHQTTSESRAADETKRAAIRFAHRYEKSFLQQSFGNNIANSIPEIDLLTAFQKERGVLDQIQKSEIDFGPVFRPDLRVLPSSYESSMPFAKETVPYATTYVTDNPEDAGLEKEEIEAAARHIGTSNALGISARHERQSEEIFGQFISNIGYEIVNIDPEGVIISPDDRRELDEDLNLFIQQLVPSEDKTSHHEIQNGAKSLRKQAEKSSKEWRSVVEQQLPDAWEDEMPEDNFVEAY